MHSQVHTLVFIFLCYLFQQQSGELFVLFLKNKYQFLIQIKRLKNVLWNDFLSKISLAVDFFHAGLFGLFL